MKRKGEVLTSSVKFKGLCIHMKIHSMKKRMNGIRIFICSLWLINGLISKNFQNTGIVLLVIRWLLMSVGQEEKGHGYSKAAAEVCKYALKFGDLSVEKTWAAFNVLKGKRLTGSFGLLWGVKIPENLADEMPDDQDLPYLEMLYKFVSGKQSYYDLASTRHVEPQATDRQSEEDERSDRPTDTTGENESVAMILPVMCRPVDGHHHQASR